MENQEFTKNEKALAIQLEMNHYKLDSNLFDIVLSCTEKMSNESVEMLFPLIGKGIL